jgi:hypothetical protein
MKFLLEPSIHTLFQYPSPPIRKKRPESFFHRCLKAAVARASVANGIPLHSLTVQVFKDESLK